MKMKNILRKAISLTLVLIFAFSLTVFAFADGSVFDDGAYASILTGSDFQTNTAKAYRLFGSILGLMKSDGLETPHSMLVGGDYTVLLYDYASPGMTAIRDTLCAVYPDMDPENIVFMQGNHDNTVGGFTRTGFYDMGKYCLYSVNENDFPSKQYQKPGSESKIQALAADIEEKLGGMIESGDRRPVFVITHVPLHHTDRVSGGDNIYASYIFDVLNKAGETLDVTFIFGHNHSGDYDDYIGGAVNFMAPGDTLLVPTTTRGEYTEQTLSFTYTNYGYLGYSRNSVTDSSTDTLTLGVIRLCDDEIRYIKYSEDGLYSVQTVERKNPELHNDGIASVGGTEMIEKALWSLEYRLFSHLLDIFNKLVYILHLPLSIGI